MRVLFEVVHPADVLFFLRPIRLLQSRHDEILILSRHKDVACDLLDQFGLAHTPVSTAGNGVLGLAHELIMRDIAIFKAARHFNPQVMIGLGGVSISHIGKLLNIPAISFYAADTASLQTRITWPFISHLYVPQAYSGPVPTSRTTRFNGIKEMSYFHRNNFFADEQIAKENGWDPTRDNFLIRIVSWQANHDLGKGGWSAETLSDLVSFLSRHGKIHISTERPLPQNLESLRYKGSLSKIHHVMAKCRLYVGESATMAHEACLLGVASIYDGIDHPGTTRELASKGLLCALHQPGTSGLLAAVNKSLSEDPAARQKKLKDFLEKTPDLATYIVNAIDRHAVR